MALLAVDLLYFTGRRGGTETYARQVLPRLADLLPGVELVGIANTTGQDAIAKWFPGDLHVIPIDGINRPVWAMAETFLVNGVARRLRADALWCPANFGPAGSRVPRIVTVHDVIPFEYPNAVARAAQLVTGALLRRTVRDAHRILTDSEGSADAIVRVLGVGRERIVAVPLAATPADAITGKESVELRELGIDAGRPYVLSTGNRLPHKNFDGLIRALATIPSEQRPQLIITGSHGADPLQEIVDELELADSVTLPGWVTTEQLESLYRGAALYVCPSFDEGFGLPVLDAMQRGVPVLASDVQVLREVGGSASAYVDPRDHTQMGAAIGRIVGDPVTRSSMRDAGLERVEAFSWSRTAQLTANALQGMLSAATGPRP